MQNRGMEEMVYLIMQLNCYELKNEVRSAITSEMSNHDRTTTYLKCQVCLHDQQQADEYSEDKMKYFSYC